MDRETFNSWLQFWGGALGFLAVLASIAYQAGKWLMQHQQKQHLLNLAYRISLIVAYLLALIFLCTSNMKGIAFCCVAYGAVGQMIIFTKSGKPITRESVMMECVYPAIMLLFTYVVWARQDLQQKVDDIRKAAATAPSTTPPLAPPSSKQP